MVHYPQAWNPQHPSSCHDAPVCLSQREIFGGSVLVEQVFSYPGLGQAAVTAGLGGDVPLLMGITIISAAIVFLGELYRQPPVRNGGSQNQEEQGMSAQRHRWNRRKAMAALLAVSVLLLAAIAIAGQVLKAGPGHGFHQKNLPPSLAYPFGTDWMGGTCLSAALQGLSISIRIGLLTACISAVVAFILGTMAACLGRVTDAVIGGIIDLVMGIPHILLLILISFAVGKGFWGVLIGVSLTHWTSLARLLAGRSCSFVRASIYRLQRSWEREGFILPSNI